MAAVCSGKQRELFLKYLTRSSFPGLLEGNLADGSVFVSSEVHRSHLERNGGHLLQPLMNTHTEIFQPEFF